MIGTCDQKMSKRRLVPGPLVEYYLPSELWCQIFLYCYDYKLTRNCHFFTVSWRFVEIYRHLFLPSVKSIHRAFTKQHNAHRLPLLKNLRVLDLSDNAEIPGAILQQMTSLVKLSLSNNNQVSDGDLKLLTRLRYLSLERNACITGAVFEHLSKLEGLSLFSNGTIKSKDLQKLRHLRYLDLDFNDSVNDDDIIHLPLELLSLHQNRCITDNALSKLTNLTQLDLGCNDQITKNALVALPNLCLINTDRMKTAIKKDDKIATPDGREVCVQWNKMIVASWYPNSV